MRILAALCVFGLIGCGGSDDSPVIDAPTGIDATAALVSIAVTGPSNLHAGDSVPFTAIGTYDDTTTVDLSSQAQWTSSLPAATTASNQVLGVGVGTTVISATVGALHGDANLTVLSPHVLIATNYTNNSILFFAPTADGNTAPLRTISGPLTTLFHPATVFAVGEEVYVMNLGSITVFPITGTGNIAPTRSIGGPLTTIGTAKGLTVFNNEIYVSTGSTTPIAVFPVSGTGNIAPTRTIGGACDSCTALAVVNNELFSNNYIGKVINVYLPTSAAGAAPLRTITDTGLDPIAMFVAGTEIFIGNLADNTMRVYPTASTGATPATRTITGLAFPGQVAVYKNEIFVPGYDDSSIRVYPIAATGAATPTRTISGAVTTLGGPLASFMY